MTLELWVEHDEALSDHADLPAQADFQRWAEAALTAASGPLDCELAIRIVGEAESRSLNHEYRDKDKPTNVLSFAAELPESVIAELPSLPLGDLVICAPVVAREAREQGKPQAAHWAHMTVHGVLHLLGHDHVDPADAALMEPLEVAILATLGWPNPYDDDEAAPADDERNHPR